MGTGYFRRFLGIFQQIRNKPQLHGFFQTARTHNMNQIRLRFLQVVINHDIIEQYRLFDFMPCLRQPPLDNFSTVRPASVQTCSKHIKRRRQDKDTDSFGQRISNLSRPLNVD